MADNKLISSGNFSSTNGGGKSTSGNSGPTGSSRSYPNAGPGTTPKVNPSSFNPHNAKPSTYGLCGTGGKSD